MIVEFIEERDFMTAWVVSSAAHRVGVIGLNGRKMNISRSRILNSRQSSDPGDKKGRLELLRATDAARRSLADETQLDELWEVLEGEGDIFSFETLAALYFGDSPGPDEVSAVSRAIFKDGLRFRFTQEGAVRNSQQELERLIATRQAAEEEQRVIGVMAQWIKESLGRFVAYQPPEAERAIKLLTDLALWGEKASEKRLVKKILEKAELSANAKGAFKALVAVGEFSLHENIYLRQMAIPLSFNEESAKAVIRVMAEPMPGRLKRLDLTSLKTMTIDSNGARDLDDAISIKSLAGGRWQVGIHITDVAAFIPEDSLLDAEARLRGSSIYLPEGKYPMLPSELSEDLLSLTPGDVKPAFSFLATLETSGEISEYSLSSSLIRVDRQFSFTEADQQLDEDSDLVDLWDLAQALIARRVALGGLNLNIPKLNIYFLPDGNLSVGLTQWDTPAKSIISELMILANYLAADFLRKNDYPCPYRYQEKANIFREGHEAPLVAAAEGNEDAVLAGSLAARRRTGRSGLGFLPAAHYGLGLPVYTSFTAPMRRYLDLLVARQLYSLVDGGPPAMGQQEFLILGRQAYELSQGIQKMQNLRQRYWLKIYLADKVGLEFSALVFEQNGRRIRVCVTDYMLETDLFLPRGELSARNYINRRVTVRLSSVSIDTDEAPKFELAPCNLAALA